MLKKAGRPEVVPYNINNDGNFTISRSTYSLIEMGRGNVFVSDLVGLKQIFKVEFDEFFVGISTERE